MNDVARLASEAFEQPLAAMLEAPLGATTMERKQ